MALRFRPYLPTRSELELIATDYARAAQDAARRGAWATCESYLLEHEKASQALELAEIDLDIPISVELLDAQLFGAA
jgi:hypothetical protein